MTTALLDGSLFSAMLKGGAARLKKHAPEINDLNVFPIPDGDTGDNMLLTVLGGTDYSAEGIGEAAKLAADGMLMSARGNSGVILSQFFDGIANGLSNLETADTDALKSAFRQGVEHAYRAVIEPVEGTVLTVARVATEYAAAQPSDTPEKFFTDFITAAKQALDKTPEQLAVLKKAGVVDSGGAGLICIAEGMLSALGGGSPEEELTGSVHQGSAQKLDLNLFTEDSELEFGYCTEVLVRLQNAKTDIDVFSVDTVSDYLKTIGNSVVAFKNGSILKIHIHTKTPDRVLAYCQRYGEFLTVKIENMSLQHNNVIAAEQERSEPAAERNRFAVVAAVSGEGLAAAFRELGANEIVCGGQSNNPSAEDFISAFRRANAEVIFVLPNNGNVVLAAKQAAELYGDADVRVIESRTVGEGYAALSMFDPDSDDPDRIADELREAMQGVLTAEISKCVRDAEMDGVSAHIGEYIGFMGKQLLTAAPDRLTAAAETAEKMKLADYDICILFTGADTDADEAEQLRHRLADMGVPEVYIINGGQEIYDYIIVGE